MALEPRRVVVLASREKAPFYRLLGFDRVVEIGKGELAQYIKELKSDKSLAAVLVEESLAREAGIELFELNEKGFGPLITYLPDREPFFKSDPRAYYSKFIARVIGYQLGV
ncbi:MAG: V-type ATP synthase subunit F [Desulfurococcaceae archaeon]|jgi:vacuolar-type H+-ATPase subunit F/Vma7